MHFLFQLESNMFIKSLEKNLNNIISKRISYITPVFKFNYTKKKISLRISEKRSIPTTHVMYR